MSTEGTACVVRHAETEWALSGRHTGRTDVPLTAHGEDEARDLAPLLGPIRFAHVLTSPLRRAMQTCTLALPALEAEIDVDLAEWDYGDYEGRRSTEIANERADWDIFRDGCPGGESPSQVFRRADRLIARVRALDGIVALFTHGQFAPVLAARWIGMPGDAARHFILGTASIGVFGVNPHHPEIAVITGWNHRPGGALSG